MASMLPIRGLASYNNGNVAAHAEKWRRDGVWVTSMCWEWNFDYKCSGCQLNVFSIVECCMFTMIWFIIICGKCSIIFYQLWLLTLSSVIVDGKKILMTLEDFKTFVACHSCVA